jgi:hypothetical protein
VKAEVAKLEFLRSMGADSLDLSGLPPSGVGSWPRSGAG